MKKSKKFDSDVCESVEDFLLFFIKKCLSLRVVEKFSPAALQGSTDGSASLFALRLADREFFLQRNTKIIC